MEPNPTALGEKRSPFDICADILGVLGEGTECKSTPIASRSRLDSRGIARYIDFLLKNDLVEMAVDRGNTTLCISDKGRKYLNQYTKLLTMLVSQGRL